MTKRKEVVKMYTNEMILDIIENVKLDYANWRKLYLAEVELGNMTQAEYDTLHAEVRKTTDLKIARLTSEFEREVK